MLLLYNTSYSHFSEPLSNGGSITVHWLKWRQILDWCLCVKTYSETDRWNGRHHLRHLRRPLLWQKTTRPPNVTSAEVRKLPIQMFVWGSTSRKDWQQLSRLTGFWSIFIPTLSKYTQRNEVIATTTFRRDDLGEYWLGHVISYV